MQKKFCYFTFKSKTKATIHGVDKLMHWDKKIIKKKVKREMRREGKEVAFQVGTYSFKTISIQYVSTWDSQKYILGKNEFKFSKQNTCKLKDLKLFEDLGKTN